MQYRRGSRIKYWDRELEAGVTLTPIVSAYPSQVLTTDGYLVFIDERPGYLWEHPAQLILVPHDPASAPVVLFRNQHPSAFRITDAKGTDLQLQGTWHDL